jgi:hypothetical protein
MGHIKQKYYENEVSSISMDFKILYNTLQGRIVLPAKSSQALIGEICMAKKSCREEFIQTFSSQQAQ